MSTWLKNPIVIFLFTVVAVLFVWSQFKTLQKTQTSTENVSVLEQEVAKISSEVSSLQSATNSGSLDFKQEQIARNELLLSKPGETLLQLPPLGKSETNSSSPEPTPKPLEAWLSLIQRL